MQPIKTSHGIAVLGVCFLIALFVINWSSKQFDSIALSIPAGSQTATISDFNSKAFAANHYVVQSGVGRKDGSDWANAYDVLPVPLIRGDIYYIAGGTYVGYSFDQSGTDLISIVKATISSHGTDTGWSDSYALPASFSGQFAFSNGTTNYLIDGVTGSNRSGYGFVFPNANVAIILSDGAGDVTVKHVEIYTYPYGTSRDDMTSPGRGITVWNGTAEYSGPLTVGDSWLHNLSVPFLWRSGKYLTVENSIIEMNKSTIVDHAEGISDDQSDEVIIRWNEWNEIEGTAYIAGINGVVGSTMNNWYIYGNVFRSDNSFTTGTPPLIAVYNDVNNHSTATNWYIYNNTIVGKKGGLGIAINTHTNTNLYNNYFYTPRTDTGWSTAGDGYAYIGFFGIDNFDYNYYSGAVHYWGQTNAAHENTIQDYCCGRQSVSIETSPPFVDWQNGKLHLVSTANGRRAGLNLGAPYNIDKDGNTRPATGAWDVGAYQDSTITITVTPPSLIPIATKFITTDLMNKDLNSVSNFEISNSFGKISFVNPVSLIHNNGPMDLDANIAITRTSIALNSNNLPELNHPARLTFNNVRISNPSTLAAIKQDNGPCSGCVFISYQNNVLVFTVPHFTDFSILEDDITPTTNSLTVGFLGTGAGSVTVGTTTLTTDSIQTFTSAPTLPPSGGGGSSSYPSGGSSGYRIITIAPIAPKIPATISISPFTTYLALNSKGTTVSNLQAFLKSNGFLATYTNGTFDLNTQKAVQKFQSTYNIISYGTPATTGYGVTGPKTRTKINSLLTITITNNQNSNSVLPSSGYSTFTRSLTIGSTGQDVKLLQILLNAKGFTVSTTGAGSKGNESTYFGPATKSALIRYQIANKIIPANGYFGLLTREKVNNKY